MIQMKFGSRNGGERDQLFVKILEFQKIIDTIPELSVCIIANNERQEQLVLDRFSKDTK
jgi:hypothetical protein